MDKIYQFLCSWLVDYAQYDKHNDYYASIACSANTRLHLKANIQQHLKGVFQFKQGRNIILRYNFMDHTFEKGEYYDEFIKKTFLD